MATIEVKLPELGEGVTEGELVRWLVKPGDVVKPDQSVAELMTDKATVEVPTPYAGTVKEILFKPGQVVKVEQILLTLEASGQGAMAQPTLASNHGKTTAAAVPMPSAQSTEQTTGQTGASAAAGGGVAGSFGGTSLPSMAATTGQSDLYPPVAESRVLATPATRRLAREMGVDINELQGTGMAGRVTREDVMQKGATSGAGAALLRSGMLGVSVASGSGSPGIVLPGPGPMPGFVGGEERVPILGIRKKIAQNMQLAKSIIPHFTLMDEADVTELVNIRESLKGIAEKNKTKITYLPFIMKALIATIREFPMFNASIDDQAQEIVYKKYFNLGFAADTPNGLVVPVIKQADHKSILQLSREILDLSMRARDGKLKLDEMKGATITITNIGSVGGTYATPIINHPEVAILGMYKITDKPVVLNGQLAVQKVMNFTITADHRLIDGAVAANFMKSFLSRVQNPNLLMVEMY